MRFAGEGHVRSRWVWALAVVLAVCFSGTATAAFATDPVSLGDEHVVDQANVLSASDEAAANDRLDQLYADTGVDLYVAIVDDFTNPADRQQWADAVASQNGLGAKQYVLVISTDGRQYYISADSSGPLSESQIASAEQAIQTQLRDGDYLAAITTGADRFTDDLTGAGGGFTVILVIILIAGAAFLIIWLIVRSRRKGKTSAVTGDGSPQAPAVPLQELERQASSALIATDDALKTSNQELGFATAQFGDAATSEFVTVIAHARADLDEAFALQQQLDDDVPDTEQQRRDWNTRIIELCAHANTELDEKAADFDELRKLEANAPEALARVQQDRTRVGGGVEAAATQLSALGAVYAPEALVTIADNPEQAKQRIEFADEQLASAQRAIGSGDGGTAAVSIRAAEEAVAQAELLDAAIAKFAADLAQGETDAAALIANLEGDIAAASALPDPDGRVAGAIAATRQQIDSARTHLAGTARRPLVTLTALEAANTTIDSVIASVRDAAAQAERSRQMLGQLMSQAQAQVSAAEDYITARRGAVGAEARTRLAEAGASLVQAQQLAGTDPDRALALAQRANDLAAQAIQAAQRDVGGFDGGMFGGGGSQQSSGSNGMLGAVLGGIVINSLLGGGGRSSGGFGGGFGSSGGGFRPGSFGGGGTRGRRGGGRF